jgi:hypothetical protein
MYPMQDGPLFFLSGKQDYRSFCGRYPDKGFEALRTGEFKGDTRPGGQPTAAREMHLNAYSLNC